MKRIAFFLLLACATLTVQGQEANDNVFTLKSGDATMTIDAGKGGKIMS